MSFIQLPEYSLLLLQKEGLFGEFTPPTKVHEKSVELERRQVGFRQQVNLSKVCHVWKCCCRIGVVYCPLAQCLICA
jgi:hypothetical protein